MNHYLTDIVKKDDDVSIDEVRGEKFAANAPHRAQGS
jgi:hypothetical protein